ncbi:MAG: bifunctional 5,10-methylene-tetrahydrofolate dehydrogenase/5,10-methylene-tetrahydrofolate cyclohydrolase, partial [Ruminococcus sp.]|nr:bifunctional 5,10-methylene-tetrahydrofolate dehydrogenase/5,10-methylene-tetrahydrofolate cyclohydrolase [Ruminococcus sp.]
MSKIIDGKQVSADVKARIAKETAELKAKGVEVGLAVVIVGEDPASQVYVRNKEKACEAVGFNSYKYALPEETTEEELLALVDKLNNDPKVNGILVQLPLPKHLNDKVIIDNIRFEKDVDA